MDNQSLKLWVRNRAHHMIEIDAEMCLIAVDCIEELEAKLAKAVKALWFYACDCDVACEQLNGTCGDTAAAALRELKEE